MTDSTERKFERIKGLLRHEPFIPFRVRYDGREIEVGHPNAVAYRPEAPFLTIYTPTDVIDAVVDDISLIERAHASQT